MISEYGYWKQSDLQNGPDKGGVSIASVKVIMVSIAAATEILCPNFAARYGNADWSIMLLFLILIIPGGIWSPRHDLYVYRSGPDLLRLTNLTISFEINSVAFEFQCVSSR